ncbi:prion-inhibition and propagation-domain-containing protein [Cercophora newfieldiana]|uniref:Prion-inhibition and propagation-domain-containing protein n=1 Tax=Cercophora newfieldiana TaxID=92897 RepID=A0AA39XVQ1_9PEZI|nr:prion-inhibition and propagation-domain-containing protein [Cercophora newfieldiana]
MEVAGLATGVVSLAMDVFDNTIRIFKFVSALVDMPQECEKYRLQLIIEYNRILAWGKAAGLVDVPEGSTLATTLGAEATELVAIVARIQWLLSEFRDLNARYGNELNPYSGAEGKAVMETKATDEDVVKQVSGLAVSYEAKKKEQRRRWGRIQNFLERAGHNAKEVVTNPRRVRWVKVDEEAFKGLLEDLHVLTERLHQLMRDHREKKIDDITAKTYREMILARNNIEDLRDMLDAVGSLITTSASTRQENDAHRNDQTLQDLVRLKKISRTSESILAQLAQDSALNVQKSLEGVGISVHKYTGDEMTDSFSWGEDPEGLRRPRGALNTRDGDIPVWIEWKTFGDIPVGHPKDKQTALRTMALAEMLHIQKPASLHTPECIGFFDDREVCGSERYAWIFKMPEGSDYETEVVSLYDILGTNSYKPSLSQRISMAKKLCSTLLNLHAVNWLHKGIFSENVIFHFDGATLDEKGNITNFGTYNPEKPILSGFEFSRPDGSNTTAREANPVWDLYRWPGIQRQPPTERNSRKTYDLYSLGLVLLEIAHWQPLHRILLLEKEDDKSRPEVPLKESKLVRDWLLGVQGAERFAKANKANPVAELRILVGDRYWKVVERCLWAHGEKGFGVGELEDQSNDSRVGIQLQEAFTVHVVEELEAIHI